MEQLKWNIVCTNNLITMPNTTTKIQEIFGCFGQGQKILTVPQITLLHVDDPNDKEEVRNKVKRINELINNNKHSFIDKIDVIDLKLYNIDTKYLIQNKIYTQNAINRAGNLYILSVSGYCKLYNAMRAKNEFIRKNVLERYFDYKLQIDESVIYQEIEFYNIYKERINQILNNIFENVWNIDKQRFTKLIKTKYHLPKSQYSVCNGKYKIDFYFDKLRIICEFDEFRHKYQDIEDKKRMDEIIKFLSINEQGYKYDSDGIIRDEFGEEIDSNNSDFKVIRIKDNDKNGVEKLIGVVLGQLLNLC